MSDIRPYFYSHAGGEPVGPVSLRDLHDLASSGQINDESLVVQEGDSDWTPWAVVRRRTVKSATAKVGSRRKEEARGDGTASIQTVATLTNKLDSLLDTILAAIIIASRRIWPQEFIKALHVVAYRATGVLVVALVAILFASALVGVNSERGLTWTALQILTAVLVLGAYAAVKPFHGSASSLVQRAPCHLPNTHILDVLGALLVVASIVLVVSMTWLAIRSDAGSFMLAGLAGGVYLGCTGGILLYPDMLGIKIRDAVPGVELAGLMSVIAKLNLLTVPVLMAILLGAGLWHELAAVLQPEKALEGGRNGMAVLESLLPGWMSAISGSGWLAFVASLLPLFAYMQYLLLHFFVDLFLSLLSMRDKAN